MELQNFGLLAFFILFTPCFYSIVFCFYKKLITFNNQTQEGFFHMSEAATEGVP